MKTVNRIIEGYEDTTGVPDDFGSTIIMAKPIINIGENSAESMIEDYCIDVSLGDEPETDEDVERKPLMDSFYKVRKKNTRNRRYWKVVVDIFIPDQNEDVTEVYRVIESVGLSFSTESS